MLALKEKQQDRKAESLDSCQKKRVWRKFHAFKVKYGGQRNKASGKYLGMLSCRSEPRGDSDSRYLCPSAKDCTRDTRLNIETETTY